VELHLFSVACPQAKEEELQLRKRELEERRNSLDTEQARSLSMALDKVLFVRSTSISVRIIWGNRFFAIYITHRSQVVMFIFTIQ